MEGDRLIHTALLILRGTTRAQQDYGPTAVSIALSFPHSQSISSMLRVRAVVWKRSALQPGGPPLRATTALHPAAVRRAWISNGKVCRLHRSSSQSTFVHRPIMGGDRLTRFVYSINRLGRRQAHTVGGRQGPVRKA